MRRQSGPTFIELLILVVILSLGWLTLMPTVFGSQVAANVTADSANLEWHGQQLGLYKLQHKRDLPIAGGHKFVLSTWSIVDKAEESFDRYFIPGRRDNDPDYRARRAQLERGGKIWEDLKGTTSLDTHYAGRAKDHLASATNGKDEALMADDNEGVWSHPDGTVNVLFHGGAVRSYSFLDLKSRGCVQGELDKQKPLETWGPGSPIPECRKLDR